jgi:hypothetical protein
MAHATWLNAPSASATVATALLAGLMALAVACQDAGTGGDAGRPDAVASVDRAGDDAGGRDAAGDSGAADGGGGVDRAIADGADGGDGGPAGDAVLSDAGPSDARPVDDRRPLGPPSYVSAVSSYQAGDGGGYNADLLPGIVEGPPHGGGDTAGSTDVVSLGSGGSIVLAFDADLIDGPGPDLVVFENAFYALGDPNHPFAEPAVVGVSLDGDTFTEWPCDLAPPYHGCAGVAPVYYDPDRNSLDPLDPSAGGDRFDLADIGVSRARFVRIRDAGQCCAGTMGTTGFDLDAVALLNHDP